MVGWKPAGTLPPNANWASLSDADQASLQEVSWNWFVREYLTAGLKAIRQALPPTVNLGAWNWPFKFWTLPPGGLPRWNAMMDEMGWLWQLMDVFIPDVYPEFYSGPLESRPMVLSNCKAENASTTTSYFQSNVDVAVRLRNAFNPSLLTSSNIRISSEVAYSTMPAMQVRPRGDGRRGLLCARRQSGRVVWGGAR
eukprot:m.134151 g.134151  ORF g.134151 m.134151 type:complete len:196 (+) comp13856_c0_seq3:1156-1743(+)